MIDNINEKTVNIKLTRGELCKVLIVLTGSMFDSKGNKRETLFNIHEKLHNTLEAFDKKNNIGGTKS